MYQFEELKYNKQQILSEQIAKHITNLIINKSYPGDKLPTELELMEMLGVSRPTIREAVKILIAQNVVEIVRGKGTFVKEKPGLSDDPLGIHFLPDTDLVISLQEWRLIIEPGITYWAAKKIRKNNLAKLRRILEDMEYKTKQDKLDMKDELLFHTTIAEASHNLIVQRLIPIITESITSTYMKTRNNFNMHKKAAQDHRKLFEALQEKDPELSQLLMRKHIERTLNNLKRFKQNEA